MTELPLSEFENFYDIFYIHFDVDGNYINIDTFIRTAESARTIVEALDKTFFGGSLNYELVVVPPEAGTFLSKLAIIGGITLTALTVFDNDITSGFVKGLTNKTPAEWAEELGKELQTEYHPSEPRNPVEDSEKFDDCKIVHEPRKIASINIDDEVRARFAIRIFTEMTRGVLERETEDLNAIGMEVGALPEAMDARADFYEACVLDNTVHRIGFTPSDEFPIPRKSFPGRAQKPGRKEVGEDEPEWSVSIENIFVTSPNWDKDDQQARKWKGKDELRRSCYFVIDDEDFWNLAKHKALHVEVLDNLRVQWACQFVDGQARQRRVLRVLEFNGENLADPLPPSAIRALLGRYVSTDGPSAGGALFVGHDERWK